MTDYPEYINQCDLFRSTKIALDTILDDEKFKFIVRKTKIICTMGPKCWSEESLGALLDKGMNVARLNFSHGTHEQHYEVLARFRQVSWLLYTAAFANASLAYYAFLLKMH